MKIYQNSHQPYLFKIKEIEYMVFCKKEKNLQLTKNNRSANFAIWNIYIKNLKTETDKKIFYIEDRIECNPSIFFENGEMFLSYITSIPLHQDVKSLKYALKKVKLDDNFNTISEEEDVLFAMSGFETPEKIYSFSYLSNFEYVFVIDKKNCTTTSLDISSITNEFGRIIPIYNSKNYIITDSLTQRSFFIENDLTFDPKRIKNKQREEVYKCSLLGNTIAYAVKKQDFEDRDIVIDEGYIIE